MVLENVSFASTFSLGLNAVNLDAPAPSRSPWCRAAYLESVQVERQDGSSPSETCAPCPHSAL